MKTKNDYLNERAEEFKVLQAKFNTETEFRTSKYLYLEESIEAVNGILKKLHLETINLSDLDVVFSSNSRQAHATIHVAGDEKFRFLKDQGYNSKGAPRNAGRLENKARKIREAFEMVGFSISVNPFSLEYREENDTVLLSWIIR